MMLKKVKKVIPVIFAAMILAGCGGKGGFADVPSDQADIWSAGSSSTELKELPYTRALELNNAVIMYLQQISADGLNGTILEEYKGLVADMKTYNTKTAGTPKYIGALCGAADCVLNFYYLNSTDAMLAERVETLNKMYNQIEKLEQTTIIKPDAALWTKAAETFRSYGEEE